MGSDGSTPLAPSRYRRAPIRLAAPGLQLRPARNARTARPSAPRQASEGSALDSCNFGLRCQGRQAPSGGDAREAHQHAAAHEPGSYLRSPRLGGARLSSRLNGLASLSYSSTASAVRAWLSCWPCGHRSSDREAGRPSEKADWC